MDNNLVSNNSQMDATQILILIALEGDNQYGTTICRIVYNGHLFRVDEQAKTSNYLVCDKMTKWPFADPHAETRSKKKSKVNPVSQGKSAASTSGLFFFSPLQIFVTFTFL